MTAPPRARVADVLPPLYARWVDELLDGPVPAEEQADCLNCSMCTEAASCHRAELRFDPAVKCCSYVPELPNFRVGQAIADSCGSASRGHESLARRIAARTAVTPLGLGRSAEQESLYSQMTEADGFGRSRAVRCPHYVDESGTCAIWRYRNAVCSTWYCKHTDGARGKRFWQALQHMLTLAEQTLAQWCIVESGFDAAVLARLFGDSEPNSSFATALDPDLYRACWGEWAGREAEFYGACADRVADLSWSDVMSICGPDLTAAVRLAREAHREISTDEIPDTLEVNELSIARIDGELCRLRTYSDLDPLEMSRVLFDLLPAFDGRTNGQVLEAIRDEHGIELEPQLLRKLIDFEILVDARGRAGPR